jgi:transglutaminase-like putative cysteine protease
MSRQAALRVTIIALLAVMAGLVLYKVLGLGYSYASIIPQESYSVELGMSFTGIGEDVSVRTFLPASEETQSITDELASAPSLSFRREQTPLYTAGEWSQYNAQGPHQILYSFSAQIRPVQYRLDAGLRIPDHYPKSLAQYLAPTEVIQLDHPLIRELSDRVRDPEHRELATLKNIYDYASGLAGRPFKGTTDAVTAAKLGEASCNGKSRLFIALARNNAIPSRLVGGLILTPGTKRTSHQWVEAYVAGRWVPFDALNSHFAELPDNYLALYRGDEALFTHSPNIGFDYRFTIKRRIVANDRLAGFLGGHGFNLYQALSSFRRVNIPLNLLKFLLMIPFGVLVVVVARNVIGVNTFGTFLPALMAVAVRETGLLAGLAGFVVILAVTALVRIPLNKLGVLHTPKLAILMVIAILTMLGLTVLADIVRVDALASVGAVTLFPIAILTITSERIALSLEEEGWKKTGSVMLWTLVVMSVAYFMMQSVALQALILAFPELFLGVVALNLWIGNWTGLRVSELLRFRSLYRAGGGDEPGGPREG